MNFDANTLLIVCLPIWALGFLFARLDARKSQLYAIVGAVTFAFYALNLFVGLSNVSVPILKLTTLHLNWFNFELSVDGFSGIQLIFNAIFLFIAVLYRPSVSLKNNLRSYFQLYMIAWTSTIILFLNDLFVFLMMIEVVFLQLFFVVAIENRKNAQKSLRGMIGYFSTSFCCSFFALLLLKLEGGEHLTVESLRAMSSSRLEIVFFMLLVSFSIRMGLVPFQGWLFKIFKQNSRLSCLIYVGFVGKIGYVGFAKFVIPVFENSLNRYSNTLCWIGFLGAIIAVMALWKHQNIQVKMASLFSAGMAITFLGIFSLDKHAFLGSVIINIVFSLLVAGVILLLNESDVEVSEESDDGTRKKFTRLMLYFFAGTALCLPGLFLFVGEIIYFFGMANRSLFLALGAGIIVALISVAIVIFSGTYFARFRGRLLACSKATVFALSFIGIVFIGFGVAPKIIVEKFWHGIDMNQSQVIEYE